MSSAARHDVVTLTRTDHAIVDVFARDGRATHAALVAAAGVSESAARRRIDRLRTAGALTFGPTVDPAQLGYEVSAHLWLTVSPAEVAPVGEAIARHPEVPFAAAITGRVNLAATIRCADTDLLYRYLTDSVGRLPGVTRVETAPVVHAVKRGWETITGRSPRR